MMTRIKIILSATIIGVVVVMLVVVWNAESKLAKQNQEFWAIEPNPEPLIIDTDGNVGFPVTNPDTPLHIEPEITDLEWAQKNISEWDANTLSTSHESSRYPHIIQAILLNEQLKQLTRIADALEKANIDRGEDK